MSSAARRVLKLPPEPQAQVRIVRERLRLGDALKLVAIVAAVGMAAFVAGYLWPRPERPPAIIEDRAEVLPEGVTQLYPRDPNRIVKWVDGAGVGREWRLTPDGAATLRAWIDDRGRD